MPIRIRVAACLVEDDRILLVTHQKGERRYQLLPGGGVNERETLEQALIREVAEETGFHISVGKLLIVCESIDPHGGRHILNMIYSARKIGGRLAAGLDGILCDAGWFERDDLQSLDMYPSIATEIERCWKERFTGEVRTLGNVWLPGLPDPSTGGS